MKKAHFKLIIANMTITTFAKKLLHEPCFLDSDNLVEKVSFKKQK